MFELVDSQPSHMVSVDALNLTPGEWKLPHYDTFLPKAHLIYINLSFRVDTVFTDFSDSDRLERFFDSEDEEFEILSLWGRNEQWFTVLDSRREFLLSLLCIRREAWEDEH